MKIAILNQPLGNRGDEAAHKAFVNTLSQHFPGSIIDVIFINQKEYLIEPFRVLQSNVNYLNISGFRGISLAEKVGIFLNCLTISLFHPVLFNFYKQIKDYDYIICAPGGICMGGFMDWNHIWQLLISKKLKKKILYWGRSIGPFDNDNWKKRLFKKRSEELLRYFSFLGLRDSKSVKIAKSLKINCTEMIDSAFLNVPNIDLPFQIVEMIKDSKYIVFVPNELIWHYRYKNIDKNMVDDFYLKIIGYLQEYYQEYKIIMLPQTYKSEINDYSYFKTLEKKSSYKNIIVIDENQNSDIQQKIIAGAIFVIGARYHSIVFAINNNIPFISLSYEHKMIGLLEKLQLLDNLIDIQNIFDEGRNTLYLNTLKTIENKIRDNDFHITAAIPTKPIINNAFNELISILNSR